MHKTIWTKTHPKIYFKKKKLKSFEKNLKQFQKPQKLGQRSWNAW